MVCVDGSLTSLPKAEKIGFTVSIVTLVALVALSSAGLRSNHLRSMLKLSKKTCILTASVSGGVLAIVLGALGFRGFSHSAQISGKRGPDSRGASSKKGNLRNAEEGGADVGAARSNNWRSLHAAVEKGEIDEVRRLLAAGVEVNAVAEYGSALHLAVNYGSALHLAVNEGHESIITILCDAGANVNAADTYGDTALHVAVMEKKLDCVQALVTAGADVNVTNGDGETALHMAARWGYREIVQALVTAGADVNVTNGDGETACDLDTEWNYSACAQLLSAPAS